jgi:hypothetical protein
MRSCAWRVGPFYYLSITGRATRNRLADLLKRAHNPESWKTQTPRVTEVTGPAISATAKPYAAYEDAVFSFLWSHRRGLGLAKVSRCRAVLVDGIVELSTGEEVVVEVKYRMNWEKACQAEWELRNFLRRPEASDHHLVGGVVFFEEFSGDWLRGAASRTRENGWNFWYGEYGHSHVDGLPFDLLQFGNGAIHSCPRIRSS